MGRQCLQGSLTTALPHPCPYQGLLGTENSPKQLWCLGISGIQEELESFSVSAAEGQVNVCAMRAAPSSKCCHPISSMQAIPVPEQTAGADEAEGAGTAHVRPQLLYHLPSGGSHLMPKPNPSLSPGARTGWTSPGHYRRTSSPVVHRLSTNPWQTHVHKSTQQWLRWLHGALWQCRAPGHGAFQRCLPKRRAGRGADTVICTSEWSSAPCSGHLYLWMVTWTSGWSPAALSGHLHLWVVTCSSDQLGWAQELLWENPRAQPHTAGSVTASGSEPDPRCNLSCGMAASFY